MRPFCSRSRSPSARTGSRTARARRSGRSARRTRTRSGSRRVVAPDRGVVDAREVGGEVDLTLGAHAETPWAVVVPGVPADGRCDAEPRAEVGGRAGGDVRAEARGDQRRHELPAIAGAVDRDAQRTEPDARVPERPQVGDEGDEVGDRRREDRGVRAGTDIRTARHGPSSAASSSSASAVDDPMSTARSARTGRRTSDPAPARGDGPRRSGPRLPAAKPGVTRTTSATSTAKAAAVRAVCQREDRRTALRRPRHDRRAVDRDEAPRTRRCGMRSRSMKRPVVTSRMMASSSQLSQRRETTSATSRASAKMTDASSPPGRRPKSAASRGVGLTWIRHPAAPARRGRGSGGPWRRGTVRCASPRRSAPTRGRGSLVATAFATSRASRRPTTVRVSRSPSASTGTGGEGVLDRHGVDAEAVLLDDDVAPVPEAGESLGQPDRRCARRRGASRRPAGR